MAKKKKIWKLDCEKTEGDVVYCNVFRDGEDVGLITGLADGSFFVDISGVRVECPCEEKEIIHVEDGKPVKVGHQMLVNTEPTKEILKEIEKEKEKVKKGSFIIEKPITL